MLNYLFLIINSDLNLTNFTEFRNEFQNIQSLILYYSKLFYLMIEIQLIVSLKNKDKSFRDFVFLTNIASTSLKCFQIFKLTLL